MTHTERLSRADWLPASTRRALSRTIARRNALDRALATARGIPADDPKCARFQGPGACAALDRMVRHGGVA